VLDGAEIVYVDKFDSPLPVAAYSRIGGRAPAYCVASGKALLAAQGLDADAAALARLLGPLVAHTANSITALDALVSELRRTRVRGYAENREEWRLGVCGLGAPVFDARGEPVAAIGMSVPSIRFTRVQAKAFATRLLACASAASTTLGFRHASSGLAFPTASPTASSSASRSASQPALPSLHAAASRRRTPRRLS
jgi:IclR family transcriptional regulator, KDG regulon repressor